MAHDKLRIEYRPLDEIHPDPDQPRQDFTSPDAVRQLRELANSIKEIGLLNPIVIRPDGMIIAGDRRWRAHYILARQDKLPDFEQVPVIVRADLASALDTAEGRNKLSSAQIVENIQRRDLTDLELGAAILRLNVQDQMGLREIARMLGKSPAWVTTKKAFFEAAHHGDPLTKDAITSGRIPTSTALNELRVLDMKMQELLLKSDIPELNASLCRAAKALQNDYLAGRMPDRDLLEFLQGNVTALKRAGAGAASVTDAAIAETGKALLQLLGIKATDLDGETIPETLRTLYAVDPAEDARSRTRAMQGMPKDSRDLSPAAVDFMSDRRIGEAPARELVREETPVLEMPRSRSRILVEFDADLVRTLLEKTGHKEVPEDRLEMTRMFTDWVKAMAR